MKRVRAPTRRSVKSLTARRPMKSNKTSARKVKALPKGNRRQVIGARNMRQTTRRQRIGPIGPLRKRTAHNHVNHMPENVMLFIFAKIDFPEMFKLRGVCHQWKSVLEGWLAGIRYIRLNFKEPDATCGQAHCALKCAAKDVVATVRSACLYPNCDNCQLAKQESNNQYCPKMPTCNEWGPKPSLRALEFAQTWVEPKISADVTSSITIRRTNSDAMATAFGSLFANLQVLLIYFDIQDTQQNIANIVQLLSNCTMLDTFAFVMSTEVENETTLHAICEALNKPSMPKLKRLDLFVSDLIDNVSQYHYHPPIDLSHCSSLLTHFGISCSFNFYYPTMNTIAVKNGAFRAMSRTVNNCALTSVSMQARIKAEEIKGLFNTNLEFRQVKRLKLTCVYEKDMSVAMLNQFWRINSLLLAYYKPKTATLDNFWLETLCQLNRLTELTLIDFALPGLERINLVPTRVHLPKVKKLTIGALDLLTRFKQHCTNQIVDVDYFGYIINYIFPGLEEITVLAGESRNRSFDDECLNTLSGQMLEMFNEKYPRIKKITIELGNEAFVNSWITLQKNIQRFHDMAARAAEVAQNVQTN